MAKTPTTHHKPEMKPAEAAPTVNIQIDPPSAPETKLTAQTLGEQAAGREALAKHAK
jgi:hypothetical protein